MSEKNNNFSFRRILAVDDDIRVLASMELIFGKEVEFYSAKSGQQALEILSKKNIDLVFLDIHMPGGIDGLEVLRRIKDSGENIHVVMVTAENSIRTAVEAMRMGAFDYVAKPFNTDEILAISEKAFENSRIKKELFYYRSQAQPTVFENILGSSDAVRQLCRMIAKVAAVDATVLIQGESGTGKELTARAIHFASNRSQKPFVAVNCAGIPENLLETELFGYEKGAFTNADRQKVGKFELSHEGTVFLDEISSLGLDMQGKILRALQQKEIERVGGTKIIKVDMRVVSATNYDLKKAVEDGRFREDLFYRLNVIPIYVPPLRDRREDVPVLVQHFLEKNNRRFGKMIRGVSEKAMSYLKGYSWPGNIRELENMVERLSVLLDKDMIETEDLPFDVYVHQKDMFDAAMSGSLFFKEAKENFERKFITAVLERTKWNQSEAARILGIHRNTLLNKSDQLGVKKNSKIS